MKHRRRTGPSAHGRSLRTAAGVLLLCGALGSTALAAAGGTAGDPAAAVMQIARQQVGDTYLWGGTGPDSWDCSGLTSRLWREVGGVKDIPRVSRDQQTWAVPIPAEQALIGDLVFFGNPVTHVSLYAGNGIMVDASSSKRGVVERKVWSSGVVRYGRVPRPNMPAVTPWTPPVLPSPTPTAAGSTSGATPAPAPASTPSAKATATPSSKATATPSPPPAPTKTPAMQANAPSSPTPVAVVAEPLRGLPGPDLPAQTTVAARAVDNARSVRGSGAWTDLELVRTAWRHAGGGALPTTRTALEGAGVAVPLAQVRVGDVVVYGAPASHVGLYVGHGYMVDASPTLGRVVVRRVFTSPTVHFIRLAAR